MFVCMHCSDFCPSDGSSATAKSAYRPIYKTALSAGALSRRARRFSGQAQASISQRPLQRNGLPAKAPQQKRLPPASPP